MAECFIKQRLFIQSIMSVEKIIAGIILGIMGMIFMIFYKPLAKGMHEFYKKMYTEKNLLVIVRVVGVLLILAALAAVVLVALLI